MMGGLIVFVELGLDAIYAKQRSKGKRLKMKTRSKESRWLKQRHKPEF